MGHAVVPAQTFPVRLYDANDNLIEVQDGVATPVGQRYLPIAGQDGTNTRAVATDATGKLDVVSSNLDATLSTRATEATLELARALLQTIDADTSQTLLDIQELLARVGDDVGSPPVNTLQGRLQELLARLGAGAAPLADTVQARLQEQIDLLTSLKDTDGVKQGLKAAFADAWPVVQVDDVGNPATITLDAGVYRQEITGKVSLTGAVPPPSTTPVNVFADNPLTVGSHDTQYTIPDGAEFHLQEITAGNEDPTKGSVVEVIFDDGSEHLVARVYTNGETVSIGYPDLVTARDGTSLLGNGAGTSDIIVRRAKYAGTNIAVDATVTAYIT